MKKVLAYPDAKPVPIERWELPGRPEVGINSVTVEERGRQIFVRNNYEDHSTTIAELHLSSMDFGVIRPLLETFAEEILRGSGVVSKIEFIETMRPMLTSFADAATANLYFDALWQSSIGHQHGVLSLESKAASFLTALDEVKDLFGDEGTMNRISRLLEAYFWLRLEKLGFHYLAVEGAKAEGGRSASSKARKAKGELQRGLAEEAIAAEVSANPGLRTDGRAIAKIVAAIFIPLNAQLKAAGLPEYQDKRLANVVGEIFRERYKQK
jgi:hypothetical protein